MKISFRFALLAAFVALVLPGSLFAQAIPDISVPDNCTVIDQGGDSHEYSQSARFLGICALSASKEQGAVTDYALTNFSFGLFLSSLNGIAPTGDQYWKISQNGIEAQVGLSDMALARGDVLTFQLTDFTNNAEIGAPISFRASTFLSTVVLPPAPTGMSGLTLHESFDVGRALSFLRRNQGADGSFGSALLNDWVSIASTAEGADDIRQKLIDHEAKNPPALSSITDYERHAMALLSLGIDPYRGTTADYITPIVNSFNGIQIGDTSLVNDDIFALFPLLNAGYTTEDEVINKIAEFIIFKQQPNGSWSESVDLTAAAIQALSAVPSLPNVPEAIRKAVQYLREKKGADGGFGNTYATSWVLQAAAALGQSVYDWSGGTHLTPAYYLGTKQERDGGLGPESSDLQSRIWATVYALPAIERKTWDSILQNYPKYIPTAETSATSTATSTEPSAATTTSSVTLTSEITVPNAVSESSVHITQPAKQKKLTTTESVQTAAASSSAPPQREVAAAASAGFLWSSIWRAITGFFARLF